METEAADHDDIECGHKEGCSAADAQDYSVLLEEVLECLIAADFWDVYFKHRSTVDVRKVEVVLQAVVTPTSTVELLFEGFHDHNVSFVGAVAETRTVLYFALPVRGYVPAWERVVTGVITRARIAAEYLLSRVGYVPKVYQKAILWLNAAAIEDSLRPEEEQKHPDSKDHYEHARSNREQPQQAFVFLEGP